MVRKWSWIAFVVIGAMGIVMSVRMAFFPEALVNMIAGVGPDAPASLMSEGEGFVALMARWVATVLFGKNLLTVVIAATAFRRGERWAVYAMCYWPAMFLSHLMLYDSGPMSIAQIAFFALSCVAIGSHLLPRRARASAPSVGAA